MKKPSISLVTALVPFVSAGCVSSAESVESGPGLDSESYSTSLSNRSQELPISAARASTTGGASPATCEDFPQLESECVWFACHEDFASCLGIQLCWRLKPDGQAVCSFWDYPDPDLCCPDTTGQVVKVK